MFLPPSTQKSHVPTARRRPVGWPHPTPSLSCRCASDLPHLQTVGGLAQPGPRLSIFTPARVEMGELRKEQDFRPLFNNCLFHKQFIQRASFHPGEHLLTCLGRTQLPGSLVGKRHWWKKKKNPRQLFFHYSITSWQRGQITKIGISRHKAMETAWCCQLFKLFQTLLGLRSRTSAADLSLPLKSWRVGRAGAPARAGTKKSPPEQNWIIEIITAHS